MFGIPTARIYPQNLGHRFNPFLKLARRKREEWFGRIENMPQVEKRGRIVPEYGSLLRINDCPISISCYFLFFLSPKRLTISGTRAHSPDPNRLVPDASCFR